MHVARYLGKRDIKVVQKKLKILEEQEYVGKRYEKSYKLQGKPAEYYLTPKGARLLSKRSEPESRANKVTEQGIKNLYKNATVSLDYVAHCLKVFEVSLWLCELYGERLQFFTRMQLIPFDYLPSWRPDGFINLKRSVQDKGALKRFFLDIWEGTRPFFVSVKKARSYITYSESGNWPVDDAKFPIMLILCDTEHNETKLRRQIRKALSDSYEAVSYATATTGALEAATQLSDRIWRVVEDGPDSETRPQSLRALTSE